MVEAEKRQRGAQWHLDKTLNISHIITTLAIATSVFIWASKMDTRLTVNEVRIQVAHEEASRLDGQVTVRLADINASLVRIEAKLDRKQDKPGM